MLEKDGIATKDLVEAIYPDEKRRGKGAFAAIECFQKIPCNPCQSSCPQKAISMKEGINDLPKVDFDKCNGCGVCMGHCPGLAITVIDETYSADEALIRLPYEFLPLPQKGDTVIATDREGKSVCQAVVRNIVSTKSQDRTPIVWLSVPKAHSMDVRCFSLSGNEDEKACECACGKDKNGETYLCRCEEITASEVRDLIAKGYTTLNEIKAVSRAGMGACQGRTCRQLIMNEIAKATGQRQDEMETTTFRPPVKPIKLGLLCQNSEENEHE